MALWLLLAFLLPVLPRFHLQQVFFGYAENLAHSIVESLILRLPGISGGGAASGSLSKIIQRFDVLDIYVVVIICEPNAEKWNIGWKTLDYYSAPSGFRFSRKDFRLSCNGISKPAPNIVNSDSRHSEVKQPL